MPMIARSNQGLFAGSDGVAVVFLIAIVGAATAGAGDVGVGRGRILDSVDGDGAEGTTAGVEDDPEDTGAGGCEDTVDGETGAAGVDADS